VIPAPNTTPTPNTLPPPSHKTLPPPRHVVGESRRRLSRDQTAAESPKPRRGNRDPRASSPARPLGVATKMLISPGSGLVVDNKARHLFLGCLTTLPARLIRHGSGDTARCTLQDLSTCAVLATLLGHETAGCAATGPRPAAHGPGAGDLPLLCPPSVLAWSPGTPWPCCCTSTTARHTLSPGSTRALVTGCGPGQSDRPLCLW